MRVLLSGSTGLIGSAVRRSLTRDHHDVLRLVRRPSERDDEVHWDPATRHVDRDRLAGIDAVVHLAGENVAARRWSPEQKARILDSRVTGTTLLCEALAELTNPPRVHINASAIGYYGDRGDDVMTEQSPPGKGFLPDAVTAWEQATAALEATRCRVVKLRIGVVLSRDGGALHRMLTPFRFGLGGRLGNGRQFMSWIALEDVVTIVRIALTENGMAGAFNAVAPHPVTNLEFTRTLGRVLGRPTILPVPALAVRLLFGQMGEELLLSSTRVSPARLLERGHTFGYPQLEAALHAAIG